MSIEPVSSGPSSPIRSRFAGDPEMSELIELFVAELPQRVNVIAAAMRDREFQTLCRISHQLKGASAGYGFDSIGKAAGAIEHQLLSLGPSADIEGVQQQVDALISLCKRAAR